MLSKREGVDHLVLPEASSYQTHLLCEGLQHSLMGEILSDEDDFGKPGRDGWLFLGRDLEGNFSLGRNVLTEGWPYLFPI